MAKICQLFSGSSGNSTFIGAGDGGILIDAGVSAKRLVAALSDLGVDPKNIHGIFLTHEHTDHICGVRVFAGKYNIPVFGPEGTMLAMEQSGILTEKFDAYIFDMPRLTVGSMTVSSFTTSHDAAASCGYRIELPDGRAVGVCTDLGFVSEAVRQGLCGCTAVVLESNHDIDMVKTGPYPYHLKERILSRRGHLSNDACAAELPSLLQKGTTRFILSHLSKENNLPMLAKRTALAALRQQGMTENKDFILQVATPCDGTPILL
ncbi:MAG: MBL fold metallo-hydrolase [Clostridia bacterium]|nr:MBL fold metallo-hydrolase [Clostridia bacterium]